MCPRANSLYPFSSLFTFCPQESDSSLRTLNITYVLMTLHLTSQLSLTLSLGILKFYIQLPIQTANGYIKHIPEGKLLILLFLNNLPQLTTLPSKLAVP